MKSKISKTLVDAILIVVGTFLMALSIKFFMLPNKITTGGASGIATILFYKFNFNMSMSILFLNIPLFIIAIRKFGLKFIFKSLITTVLFTFFVEIINLQTYVVTQKVDIFISTLYGGLLLGLGISLVFKAGASTGGSDLLAQILQKKDGNFNLSKIMLIIDTIIITGLIIVFNDINLGLYSVIAIYVSSRIIDLVFEGVNYTKVVNIITKNDTTITNQIIDVLKRGATVTKCIGAYTKNEYINITCVVTRGEISKIKRIAYDIDPNAFIYISNTNEVWGRGFKKF